MKSKFYILAAILFMACSCASMKVTPEEQARIAETVDQNIAQQHFTINVSHMYPLRGMSKHLSGTYCVEVDGEDIDSYLPYIGGVSGAIPYGGGKGLNFEGKIIGYESFYNESEQRYEINMVVDSGEDTLYYSISVYSNASAYVMVRSRIRDQISYSGEMDTRVKEEEKP